MEKEIVRLTEEQCLEITLRATSLPYKKGSKVPEGSTYSRYSYNGIIFNVNDALGFKEALAAQDLASVKLLETTWDRKVVNDDGDEIITKEKGFEFDSFVTQTAAFAKELRRAKHDAAIITIKRVAEAASLTEEGKAALLDASI